jgi:hypothetical protein
MFGVRPRPNGRCNDEPVMVLRCKVVGWSETWGKWGNGRVFCFWLGWVKTTVKTSSLFWEAFLIFYLVEALHEHGVLPWVPRGGGGWRRDSR